MGESIGTGSGRQRIALVINGDHELHHLKNARIATEELEGLGYDVTAVTLDGRGGGRADDALRAIHGLAREGRVEEGDEVVVYFTGHGAKVAGEPAIEMADRAIMATAFVGALKSLSCETTIVMDQCYSGSFAKLFADDPDIRFIGLSGKGLTDFCQPFAPRFWNPHASADDDSDGRISWQERFDWATEDSGVHDYSLAVYFTGENIDEKPFHDSVIEVRTRAELENAMSDLDAGLNSIVLFSAPWCKGCKVYKRDFMKQVDGRYQMIIAESDDPSEFLSRPTEGFRIPQVRIFGYGLPDDGLQLGVPRDLDEIVPVALANRNPRKLALHWLRHGTLEEKMSAVEILGETSEGTEKIELYQSVAITSRLPIELRTHALDKMADLHFDKRIGMWVVDTLRLLMLNGKLPPAVRAVGAGELTRLIKLKRPEKRSRENQSDLELARGIASDFFVTGDLAPLKNGCLYSIGLAIDLDRKDVRRRAIAYLDTRRPFPLLFGMATNERSSSEIGKELVRTAVDPLTDPNLRFEIATKADLPWRAGQRFEIMRDYFLSPKTPMAKKVSKISKTNAAGIMNGDLHDRKGGYRFRATHEVALKFLKMDPPLEIYNVAQFVEFLWDHENATNADRELLTRTIESAARRFCDERGYEDVDKWIESIRTTLSLSLDPDLMRKLDE